MATAGLGRRGALVLLDVLLLTVSYVLAYWLRLGEERFPLYAGTILYSLAILVPISLYLHVKFGLYNAILKYASVETALAVVKAVGLSVLITSLVLFLSTRLESFPRSILIIHAMAAVLLVGGSRMAFRLLSHRKTNTGSSKRIVLYGAGDAAARVLRELRHLPPGSPVAVALIDDDPKKRGSEILGVPIRGGLEMLREVVVEEEAQEIWVAIRVLPGEKMRQIAQIALDLKVPFKVLPSNAPDLTGPELTQFREPKIEDLLKRPPRKLDRERMRKWIEGRRVLITGAGGSIGSELSRQVASLGPSALALCDASEENLFEIHRELSPRYGDSILRPYLVNVQDEAKVKSMFEEAKPQIVFHAAAYKHVPLVELNPCEGILNNVGGTWVTANAALAHNVEDFVFISTDKAVRPANVMGATKRLGELIVRSLNQQGKTRFTSVRFGNVLGSSGSVVPIFQEQIRRGGPVTVTHPEMTRYFMLIPEAVELVIQAGSIGKGGETFLLDMGQPVRIVDMAELLIRLMGGTPGKHISISFTGSRPGEKLHEELLVRTTDLTTGFPDLFIDGDQVVMPSINGLADMVERLFHACRDNAESGRRALKDQIRAIEGNGLVSKLSEIGTSLKF